MRGIGGSTLRGGQTVFHGIRMWGQLFQAALLFAAFMTVAVPAWTLWQRTTGAEWYAAGMVTLAEVQPVLGYDPETGQEIRFEDGTRRVLRIRCGLMPSSFPTTSTGTAAISLFGAPTVQADRSSASPVRAAATFARILRSANSTPIHELLPGAAVLPAACAPLALMAFTNARCVRARTRSLCADRAGPTRARHLPPVPSTRSPAWSASGSAIAT